MLYGVRRDLQRKLVAEGYNVRVYVPFGHEWYPYFMRRLAERPANVSVPGEEYASQVGASDVVSKLDDAAPEGSDDSADSIQESSQMR